MTYRIYISINKEPSYLSDWIICDDNNHLVFRDKKYAMKFSSFDAALSIADRMREMNYTPHIEG